MDVPVCMVVNLAVTNAREYRQCEKEFFPILKCFGGKFLTFDDNPVALKGLASRLDRMMIFSFPFKKSR
jgi:uncharacterized protein (DUF1330 family)